MSGTEQHLGDGLFARFDGYQIRLRAPRTNGDHIVYLEDGVFQQLLEFAKRTAGWGAPPP